jgi:two-component system response regulator AtoC
MATEHRKVLVVDDEENIRHLLKTILEHEGYRVRCASDGAQALEMLEREGFEQVLCDVRMPVMDGLAFLAELGRRQIETTVIMMSAYGTIESALEAMKAGAYDYVTKPFKRDEVVLTLRKAAEREHLRRENRRLRAELEGTALGMVAKSEPMRRILNLVAKVADYKTTVLITGESGTGKELIAQAIHRSGCRAGRPLVSLNCAALPETLLESELFGHVKGAFTDAVRDKAGLINEADGGTLLLDEIGEMPVSLQVKLLRVLQEEEVRPVGGTTSRKVDVRVLAATARDLEREVAAGRFREDLFYRLNVLPIHIPPLRQRPEDIPPLVAHFVAKYNLKLGLAVEGLTPAAMSACLAYDWPGNVRELENALERAMVLTEERTIGCESLPPAVQGAAEGTAPGLAVRENVRALERQLIIRALEKSGGNRTQASKLLQISHPCLLSKIRDYGIEA